MKIVVVYDDTGRKSEVISDVIGDKGFSDVVVKKRRLEDYYKAELEQIFSGLTWLKIHSVFEYADLMKRMEIYSDEEVRIMHCFSNYLISEPDKAALSFRKLEYIDETYGVTSQNRAVVAMFPSVRDYLNFCKNITTGQHAWDLVRNIKMHFEIEGLVDIGVIGNFIQCVTGNFDSRYFNSLQGDEYTIVKSSVNKKKIFAEYTFYHLLPDDMKFWFVGSFGYREEKDFASYRMERLHMTDLAIKWVHGSMGTQEFEELMDMYFYFFRCRHVKVCPQGEYQRISDELYIRKVEDRISEFKRMSAYRQMEPFLKADKSLDIDALVGEYFRLKNIIERNVYYPPELVIGHGDPCFANALYNKSTRMLKFIDPKGAVSEDEMWTNPYYDIAKLSHSICGKYDFFNNAMFDIKVGSKLAYELDIPFDNTIFVQIFKKRLEENGFDYLSVRIYEASLFLSMLPLHMDNPQKALGFILNIRDILEEVNSNV